MHRQEFPTDGELLRRAAARDADAFSVLYERYEAVVAAFLVRRTHDPELTADLTAETFAQAVLSAGMFHDEGQSAVSWLLGIAHNLLRRSRERGRAEARARTRLGMRAVVVSDASLERVEALVDLEAAGNPLLRGLAALPDGERAAVRAYVLDEQPYPEVAGQLGITEAAARQRVRRGLQRMRARLGGTNP